MNKGQHTFGSNQNNHRTLESQMNIKNQDHKIKKAENKEHIFEAPTKHKKQNIK